MKIFKKALAILMVAAMLATMGISASAITITGGVAEYDADKNTYDDFTSVEIPKAVKVIKSTATDTYVPAIDYTYSIAPANNDQLNSTEELNILPGIAGAVSLENGGVVTIGGEEMSASASGEKHTANLKVNVDASKFSVGGYYRYVITDETAIADLYDLGVVKSSNENKIFYLDVYVRDVEGEKKVYGYVLSNVAEDGKQSAKTGELDEDSYTSVVASVKKEVSGDLADKNKDFSFKVTVDNNGQPFKYGLDGTDLSTYETQEGSENPVEITFTLKHGQKMNFTNLSPKATIQYVEDLSSVSDPYLVSVNTGSVGNYVNGTNYANSASDGTAINSKLAELFNNDAVTTVVLPVSNYDEENSDESITTDTAIKTNINVTYVNALNSTSPTGVLFRVAPFAVMLGAGLFLVLFFRRRREEA